MNTTGALLNGTDTTSCPLDNVRTQRELALKYFVANFVSIAIYIQFVWRRDRRAISFDLVLFFLCPIAVLARYIFALLGIVCLHYGKVIYRHFKHEEIPSHEDMITSLRWLFGVAPPPTTSYSLLPTTDQPQPELLSTAKSYWPTLGRVILVLAFMVQCVGSIYLYRRRQQHDAVDIVDQQVFELACSGLFFGGASLLQLVGPSLFSDLTPANEGKLLSEKLAVICRGPDYESDNSGKDFFDRLLCSHYGLLTGVLSCILLPFFSSYDLHWKIAKVMFHEFLVGEMAIVMGPMALSYGIVFYVCLCLSQTRKMVDRYFWFARKTLLAVFYFVGGALSIGASYIFLALFMTLVTACSMRLVLHSVFLSFDLAGSTAMLVTTGCQRLWSDPVAQWTWGLM